MASVEVFDRIEFGLVISLNGSWHASTIAIAINGRDLCDIIARVEAPQAACHGNPRAAGGYHDLSLGELRASVREHLLGEPGDTQCVTAGKSVLLICTCGEIGCQAVAVRIEADGRTVVWRDAENTNQPGHMPPSVRRGSIGASTCAPSAGWKQSSTRQRPTLPSADGDPAAPGRPPSHRRVPHIGRAYWRVAPRGVSPRTCPRGCLPRS